MATPALTDEMVAQLFENYRAHLAHEREVLFLLLLVSGALFAGLSWCYKNRYGDRLIWIIPALGILSNGVGLLATMRSEWRYGVTVEAIKIHVPQLAETMKAYQSGWPPAGTVAYGAPVLLILMWIVVLGFTLRNYLKTPSSR